MTNSTPSDPSNSYQVGGTHYQSALQHWDFVAAYGLDYFQGVATKYITRWRNKNGLEDLKKAQHYLRKRIELTTVLPMYIRTHFEPQPSTSIAEFCKANCLGLNETDLVALITEGQLHKALEQLTAFIAYVERQAAKGGAQ